MFLLWTEYNTKNSANFSYALMTCITFLTFLLLDTYSPYDCLTLCSKSFAINFLAILLLLTQETSRILKDEFYQIMKVYNASVY